MMDNAGYGDNDLMQEIREKYGTRPDLEGTTETSRAIQDGVRSSITESGQPGGSSQESSGTSSRGKEEVGRKPRKVRRDLGTPRGSYRRKGRANQKVDQHNSRVNYDSRSANGKIQLDERESSFVTKEDYAKEEDKPAGLATKPNAKERRIRQEQEQEQAARAAAESARAEEQAAPHFFAWLRHNNKRKTSEKDKPNIRTKPLSAKQAEEIRQPLIDAMADYFKYADELMSGTNASGVEAMIFQTIDDEEIGILVDAWLTRAQEDPAVANAVVQAVNLHYKFKVGLILLPRFYKAFQFYVDNGIRSPFPAARRKQNAKRRPFNIVSTNN